jgi:hypothetical protein
VRAVTWERSIERFGSVLGGGDRRLTISFIFSRLLKLGFMIGGGVGSESIISLQKVCLGPGICIYDRTRPSRLVSIGWIDSCDGDLASQSESLVSVSGFIINIK